MNGKQRGTRCNYFSLRRILRLHLMVVALLSPWSYSWACDVCAVYNSILSSRGPRNSLNVGVAQQFISASSGVGGEDQYLESSITQPFLNYYVTNQLSLQVNFPLISRHARRLGDTGIEYKEVSGVGDIPLLIKYQAVTALDSDSSLIWEIFGGIKLPTGSTDELREQGEDDTNDSSIHPDGGHLEDDTNDSSIHPDGGHLHDAAGLHGQAGSDLHDSSFFKAVNLNSGPFLKHGGELHGSLVDGHDLSLGTGSFDWLGGISLFAQSGRNYFNGLVQYSLRQKGDYGFQYGDDLQWHVGPGRYLILEDEQTAGFRVRFSGDWKQDDIEHGSRVNGSCTYTVFTGPELMATFGNRTFLSLGSDFLIASNSAREGVLPHVRYSVVLSHRF